MDARLIIIIFGLAVLLTGCRATLLESRVELVEFLDGPMGRGSTMFRGAYYCGTKGEYHYVCSTLDRWPDQWFRIHHTELTVVQQFPRTRNRAKWINIRFLEDYDELERLSRYSR